LQLTRRTDHVEAMAPPYVVFLRIVARVGRGGHLTAAAPLPRLAPPFQVTAAVSADGAATDEPKRFVAITFTRSVAPTSVGATT
jgi:hypothetical protein